MSLTRKFLRDLLESEEGQKAFQDIFHEITAKRTQQVWVMHEDRRKDGSIDHRKKPVDVEVYALKDVITMLRFMADFGVGKPPEEKKIEIDVNHIQKLSDAELYELAEADVRELPPGA